MNPYKSPQACEIPNSNIFLLAGYQLITVFGLTFGHWLSLKYIDSIGLSADSLIVAYSIATIFAQGITLLTLLAFLGACVQRFSNGADHVSSPLGRRTALRS